MLKFSLFTFIAIFLWLTLGFTPAQAQENYPMMLTVKLNNGSNPNDKMEILKINTLLKKTPAPKSLIVYGFDRKTESYAIFIKDYLVGQPVEDTKAVYPYLRNELLKLYPKATFDNLHFTYSGNLEK